MNRLARAGAESEIEKTGKQLKELLGSENVDSELSGRPVMAWNGPKWLVSQHNFAPQVVGDLSFPEKMEIYDLTLEGDGEEMPGAVFTKQEKLEIAEALDGVGVQRINAGRITASLPEDLEAVKEISRLGLDAKVEAFIEVSNASIDLALKADIPSVFMELPSSNAWIESSSLNREETVDRAVKTVTYAKEHGLHITFGLQDATRADLKFLMRFITSLEHAKADGVCIADSSGVASPEGFRHLIRMVTDRTEIPVAIHCHNDFGLATANALAGLSAGARIVTTTVNGIGERCGLTSLEEVAVALRLLYNVDLGIKLEKLRRLSRIVDQATGGMISKLKPVVGERAFAWETDGFVERTEVLSTTGRLKAGLSYEPDLVGNNFKLYPGKKMGKRGIMWEADKGGIHLTNEQAGNLLLEIKELSRRKRQPSDQRFLSLLRKISHPNPSRAGRRRTRSDS